MYSEEIFIIYLNICIHMYNKRFYLQNRKGTNTPKQILYKDSPLFDKVFFNLWLIAYLQAVVGFVSPIIRFHKIYIVHLLWNEFLRNWVWGGGSESRPVVCNLQGWGVSSARSYVIYRYVHCTLGSNLITRGVFWGEGASCNCGYRKES